MMKYRIDAEVSIDHGTWEPYSVTIETTDLGLPSTRRAAWKVKDSMALTRTDKDTHRVKVRNARVTNLN